MIAERLSLASPICPPGVAPFLRWAVAARANVVICGGAGAGRRKGFCSDCYSKLGGAKGSPEMIEALKRRKEREKLEHGAAASARKEASKVGEVAAAAATASFTE